jgi:patatin-like phospholipase/acyl hydrolase
MKGLHSIYNLIDKIGFEILRELEAIAGIPLLFDWVGGTSTGAVCLMLFFVARLQKANLK